MSITQVSRIQHRRGLRIDLPSALNDAEFGWADDTRELFIGNGPASAVGGNTQILTEVSAASLPQYTYISNTEAAAVTGFDHSPFDPLVPNPNYPTVRSYQEKFDDYVSVKDYGALGDGSDDIGAIRRAMFDIYDETASPISVLRKFRTLYFPAGTYTITKEMLLYPNTVLLGDGPGRTVIRLAEPAGVPAADEECVARTVDSLGQVGAAIDGSAAYAPGNVIVFGVSFESETSNTLGYTLGQIDIIKLDDTKKVRFENCEFTGTWTTGAAAFSRSIHIDNPGATVDSFGDYTFDNCQFKNNGCAFSPVIDVSNIYVVNSKLDTMRWGALLGDSDTLDISLFRISHSIFENISDVGFDVQTIGVGNISTYNHYRGNTAFDYTVAAVRFAGLTDFVTPTDTTSGCVSLGDTFDIIDPFTCVDKLTNTRVQNRSLNNIVMNAQDEFQIPFGFCGNILVDGDLTVTGSIVSGGTPFTASAGVAVITVPYTPGTGESIFFDYAMKVPTENVYRVGTLRVIHNGGGTPSDITYDETYAELNGTTSQPIALQAEFDVGDTIKVTVIDPLGAALSPSFNFLTRTISL